ncbi:DUF6223 family protein [Streptomyces sp. NPDC047928]|uniref:DUF6223 family protein n=1 Tax=unclassified Streptomyces TaxID=2593676 RepID=UPI00371EDD6C
MSVRYVLAVAGGTLIGGAGLAVPAAAPPAVHPASDAAGVSVQQVAATAYDLSAGRLWALVAALVGLTGLVIGGLALARPTGRVGILSGPSRGAVAVAAGLISAALGALVAATSAGGVGTGNGLGGAVVAVVLGLIGMVLGGLVLARSRRTT